MNPEQKLLKQVHLWSFENKLIRGLYISSTDFFIQDFQNTSTYFAFYSNQSTNEITLYFEYFFKQAYLIV